MSCGYVIAKDLMKTENSKLNAPTSATIEGSSRIEMGLTSFLEQVETPSPNDDHQKALFRKYLFSKSHRKTRTEESQAICRNAPPRCPLIPPKCDGSFRQSSNLERLLLPGIKNDAVVQTSSGEKGGSAAQLTIFYSGIINVYDNVPVDKAQAIMLLAGGSSSAPPFVTKLADTDLQKPLQTSNLPSVCTLQADFPIARKHSLQCFLKKRHDRIISKSPYAPPSTSKVHEDDDNCTAEDAGLNEKRSFSPSPFPSRLGYFFPLSANKDR